MTAGWIRSATALVCALVLTACGGGGDTSPVPATPSTPSTPPPSAPSIGPDGGTATGAGVSVVVPAGAVSNPVTIRIAKDSTGAPALPAWLTPVGDIYAITPHGASFTSRVEVRIPAPSVNLAPNEQLAIAKASPGGSWEVLLGETVLRDGVLVAPVSSFSFFAPVKVPPGSALELLRVTPTLTCEGYPNCFGWARFNTTLSWTTNNGALPVGCEVNPRLQVRLTPWGGNEIWTAEFPVANGSVTHEVALSDGGPLLSYFLYLKCDGGSGNSYLAVLKQLDFGFSDFPQVSGFFVRHVKSPLSVDTVDGATVTVDAVFTGGAFSGEPPLLRPTREDSAIVEWQRSDDLGASWNTVARSYQWEAYQNPARLSSAWVGMYWKVSHAFTATSADNGALIRGYACYAPLTTAPFTFPGRSCATGNPTRINVLQRAVLPAIVDQPRSLLVKTGETASFSTVVSGAPAPTLQWQTRDANGAGAWADVASGIGMATANFTTVPLTLTDNGRQYRLVATNAFGSAVSAPVSVSVSDLDVPPTITTQPANLSVTTGNDAVFAIAARGTEALSYQWFFNGNAIAGANSAVLRLAAVTAAQAGSYTVRVSNAAGNVTSNAATLTVSNGGPAPVAPSIVTQPVSVTVNAGNTATFAIGATGTAPLSYQWLKNGQPINGATAAYYSIAAAAAGDVGSYSVQITNGIGSGVTSAAATLTVNTTAAPAPVAITTQPSPQVQAPGGSATFAVAVTGSGPITYQWLKGGSPINGATGAVLVVNNVTSNEAGSYAVTVTNGINTVTSNSAALIVLGAPTITTQPTGASVTVGQTATFNVVAAGSSLLYQWTRNGIAIAGATSASYTTPALTLADSGAVYGVIVYNGAGLVVSSPAVLAVAPAPVPPGMAILAGDFSGGGGGNAVDGVGTAARFDFPEGLTVDPAGNLYVAQPNGRRVAKIAPDATVTTIVNFPIGTDRNNLGYVAIAPDGALWTAGVSYTGLFRTTPPLVAGAFTEVLTMNNPTGGAETRGIAVDSAGKVYLAFNSANTIARIDGNPPFPTTVAGSGNVFAPAGSIDGDALTARFNNPRGIAFASNGDMYIADSGNHTIRRMTPLGQVTTFAGVAGQAGLVNDNGAAARFDTPTDLAFDPDGNLIVLQRGAAVTGVAHVRRITPAGDVTTLFNATVESVALASPGQEAFAANIKGLAVLSSKRIALTAGNAVIVRTLP